MTEMIKGLLMDVHELMNIEQNMIITLMQQTNIDPQNPNCHVYYVKNINSKYGEVYTVSGWQTMEIDEMMEQIIENNRENLNKVYVLCDYIFNENVRSKVQETIDELEDPKCRKTLKKTLKRILYENRHIIRKTYELTKKLEENK